MNIRLTIRKSDTEYLAECLNPKVLVSGDVITSPKSETVSSDLNINFKSIDIPFAFFPEKGLSIKSKKIISGLLRKHAVAWANLASK